MEISAIMKSLRRQGIEEIFVKILEDICKESTAIIKLHKVSDKIPIQKRVRQGDTISHKKISLWANRKFLRTWNGKSQEFK